jgi:hypothetical protein
MITHRQVHRLVESFVRPAYAAFPLVGYRGAVFDIFAEIMRMSPSILCPIDVFVGETAFGGALEVER